MPGNKFWSEDEIEFLRREYARSTWRELTACLTLRSRGAINRKAQYLGLAEKNERDWTDIEDAYLRRNYPNMGDEAIAEELRRTSAAVNLRAGKLKLIKTAAYTYSLRPKRLPLPALSVVDLAYIAGIVDGEGCVYVEMNKNGAITLRLTVGNTNKAIIDWLVEKLGGSVHTRERRGKWRTAYAWYESNSSRVVEILQLIVPYSIIKREQMMLAMQWVPGMDKALAANVEMKIKNLNQGIQ